MSTPIAYYNERDPFAAAWLIELIKEGVIADGIVDDRDIQDVRADELAGYTQCHFFAGIGGWSYALRLAGWPDDRPVWTGSCPCQPFSTAGKRGGTSDERHLWPSWFHLIQHGKPHDVPLLGEQVDAAVRQGWLDLVQADMEGIDHTVWAVDFPACGVGAFHKRQRLYFVAQSLRELGDGGGDAGKGWRFESSNRSGDGELAHSPDLRRIERRYAPSTPIQRERTERSGEHAEDGHAGELPGGLEGLCGTGDGSVDNSPSPRRDPAREWPESETRDETWVRGLERGCEDGGVEYPKCSYGARFRSISVQVEPKQETGRSRNATPWSDAIFIGCADGKARPVEPTIFPLAHGIPNRVGLLRGAGNAIVPQAAAEFIAAYIEATNIIR